MSLGRMSIDEWFKCAGDESEFVCNERTVAYSVVGPSSADAPFIFATKPACIFSSARTNAELGSIGLIGRYGLPNMEDISWIRDIIGQRKLKFLGDMDPVDLMVFAWLRTQLDPVDVIHVGVSDSYLQKLRVDLPPSFVMSCAPSELSSLSFLEAVFPDFREVVGPHCAELLHEGCKIELEAVVSALGNAAPLLTPALL